MTALRHAAAMRLALQTPAVSALGIRAPVPVVSCSSAVSRHLHNIAELRVTSSVTAAAPVKAWKGRQAFASASGNSSAAADFKQQAATSDVVLENEESFAPSDVTNDDSLADSLVPRQAESLARHRFDPKTEAALNHSINVAYTMSYTFHALQAYFGRDYVALPGFSRFFSHRSLQERKEADRLIRYQNMRGGQVHFMPILAPQMEYEDGQKGDALNAMETTLAMEKLQDEKYLALNEVAEKTSDAAMHDFVVNQFLHPQSVKIRRTAEFVAQLRRVGKGSGVWRFNQMLFTMDGSMVPKYIDPTTFADP